MRASSDGTGKVWDIKDDGLPALRATLEGHLAPVLSIAFAPDGSRLATGSSDRSVRVWEEATGRRLSLLAGHRDRVLSVTFSPDGTEIFSGGDAGVLCRWAVPANAPGR